MVRLLANASGSVSHTPVVWGDGEKSFATQANWIKTKSWKSLITGGLAPYAHINSYSILQKIISSAAKG